MTARPAARAADTRMLLHIDWTACDGRGLCTEILPELLGRDEWGYPISRGHGSDVPVSDRLVPAAVAGRPVDVQEHACVRGARGRPAGHEWSFAQRPARWAATSVANTVRVLSTNRAVPSG